MSLNKILNSDPSPALSTRSAYLAQSRAPNLDAVSPISNSSRHSLPPYQQSHSSHQDYSDQPTPRNHYHSLTYGAQPHLDTDRYPSPDTVPDHPRYQEAESVKQPRKRRKAGDGDSDYHPSTGRRHSPRKAASRAQRPHSPVGDLTSGRDTTGAVDDQSRLNSSDLDDCEEVWLGALSEYMLETQKRQHQVEKWFEASVVERNESEAQRLSQHYVRKIASIPPPLPPSPIPIVPPVMEDDLRSPSPDFPNGFDHKAAQKSHRSRRPGGSAEDVAHEFERSMLGDSQTTSPRTKHKPKPPGKRTASDAASDASSDLEIPSREDRLKRRRIEPDSTTFAGDGTGEPIPALAVSRLSGAVKGKGKSKLSQRDHSQDSQASTPKSSRRKPAQKKKAGLGADLELEITSLPASGEITPVLSRPSSPTQASSTFIFELDEAIPPLRKAKKIDDAAMVKRVKILEEAQRKVWTNIAKRDIAKVYKYQALGSQTRISQAERLVKLASMQARKPFTKTAKANKDTQAKAKRLMREMQVFWKKNEKEERDVRKREQKEASDRMKIEEEKREAARQARKLEFLISQTELYSHFVGSKLKTTEIEGESTPLPVPVGANLEDVDPNSLTDINFDDEDSSNLHRHARHNAQEAIALAKQRAQQFDAQAALDRKTNEALRLAKPQAHIRDDSEGSPAENASAPLVDLDSDELNFQNPTSLSGPLTVKQPKMLEAQLKEYQLKGLNWLATLYEQGINGILADEMGLGKTVQSISLLAHLAEKHDIWGPFLVVAPASTLHNWQQELTRFVPRLKAIPYWGNVKDRATLRKFWSKKEISYDQNAPFHVLITSYQLVTQDQQYFQRVKWQYMILDEAQNIKNSSSVRWKTLLGFHCRNRLLLTGTPIQNSMQELWALLHFIMPSLFDSHDEFNEWFSKDIENAAENKGSKLNEHQLRRLHMILKPFMLRRVKRHVQNELSEKIEIDIYVDLSARQRALYKALLANVSVADLLAKAANIGDVDSARSLMNLVMQFRKVCNHPELFERADVVAPFSFAAFGRSGSISREGDYVSLAYSTRNPISFTIPELLYQDGGLLEVPSEESLSRRVCLSNLFNIWTTDRIHNAIYEPHASSFSFLRFTDTSVEDAHSITTSPLLRRWLLTSQKASDEVETSQFVFDPAFAAHTGRAHLRITELSPLISFKVASGLPSLRSISQFAWMETCLSRSILKWFVPPVVAPPISLHCTDRTFLDRQSLLLEAPLESSALYGLPEHLLNDPGACEAYHRHVPGLPVAGLFGSSPPDQLPMSTMQVPEAKRLIYDSAKLARLDALLQELKTGDHRVLVYFQMTRMMDLMEEYLIYRQYKYLRLDGSSKLEDRRDMVIDWQTRPDIFVFLLSTRAGGLGINLTAADTVVFYDHDWNPSNDAQAMDRAHRLGQTRQVTVYRLITKGTIDERIVQLARVKKDVQDIVVGTKNFTDVAKPSEIVQLLLNDEQLASLNATSNAEVSSSESKTDRGAGPHEPVRDLWNEEGDDFFSMANPNPGPSGTVAEGEEDAGTPVPNAPRGKKRKGGGAASGARSRKASGKRKATRQD